MAPAHFVLITHYEAKNPQRQYALQMGEVKAHAARISHAKRRMKRQHGYCQSCKSLITQDYHTERWDSLFYTCPLSILGQSKRDPFESGQSHELPTIMQMGLDWVYDVLWPKNSPALQGSTLTNTISAWRNAGIQSDLEYHAQVANAASLCLASSENPEMQKTIALVRLVHQNKALQLIQQAIMSLTQTPSIALITAIMNVSTSGLHEVTLPESVVPQSPVFSAFVVRLYCRFDSTDKHFNAAVTLIRQRGGLETLPLGLANPLQLEDVSRANVFSRQPVFPLLSFLAERGANPAYTPDADAVALLNNLGSGFRYLPEQDHDRRLWDVMLQACHFVAASDQYQRASPLKCSLSELATQSIVIQHRLLSLPVAECEETTNGLHEEYYRYEIARLTALVFADLVIFPSMAPPLPRPGLANLLYETLMKYFGDVLLDRHSLDPSLPDLVLWSLVLGGITATGTGLRSWYATRLFMHATEHGLAKEDVDNKMRSFLYWDYIMGDAMEKLWNEAVR